MQDDHPKQFAKNDSAKQNDDEEFATEYVVGTHLLEHPGMFQRLQPILILKSVDL